MHNMKVLEIQKELINILEKNIENREKTIIEKKHTDIYTNPETGQEEREIDEQIIFKNISNTCCLPSLCISKCQDCDVNVETNADIQV